MKFSARILASLSFCHLLNDLMQSLLPSIYPMLKQAFGLSFRQIGLITLVSQITALRNPPRCDTDDGRNRLTSGGNVIHADRNVVAGIGAPRRGAAAAALIAWVAFISSRIVAHRGLPRVAPGSAAFFSWRKRGLRSPRSRVSCPSVRGQLACFRCGYLVSFPRELALYKQTGVSSRPPGRCRRAAHRSPDGNANACDC